MMRKITYLFIFLFLANLSVNAQIRKKGQRIKALKVAHITEQLDLTEQEAREFWPIYNAYEKKINSLRFKGRQKIKREVEEFGGLNALTEDKAKEIIIRMNKIKSEFHKTEQEFQEKLKTILSFKKILKLEIAEKEFQRRLIKKLKSRR